jgi:CRP/FNR family cyclic AMP-dependent transcriptional regulator
MICPDITDVLSRNHLFQGLPDRIIDRIAKVASRRNFGKNEGIFSQGDKGDALFCILSGRVRISSVGVAGQEVFLNIMGPGDSFGEIAVVDGLPRTAGAKTMDAVSALVIRRNDFLGLLREESELGIHLLRLFCERMRWTSNLYEDSAFLTAPARLAKRLLSLAILHGRPVQGGFELRISQSDLAHFLGMSRQIVNQHLQTWRGHGWLEVARARLVIKDANSLRQVAGYGAQSTDELPS